MLFNREPERFSLLFNGEPCRPEDTVLVFRGNEVLLHAEACKTRLPQWTELSHCLVPERLLQAFQQADTRVFLATVSPETAAPEGFVFEGVRIFRLLTPPEDAFTLITAYHLSQWYANHRFCGACGGETQPAPVERALICPRCGLTQYPTISPAVITAITNGDRILLARNASGAFRHFSLIAGYVEVGESLEQAVAREIQEEVGLRVKEIRYLASQPWGLSQTLMIGFQAKLDGPADIILQESELAEARWFRRDELPSDQPLTSIAFEIIERFRLNTLNEGF